MFAQFLLPTSTHWISKSIVFPKERQCFLKKRLSKLTSIFDRFWHPKTSKIHAKIDTKRHQKNHRFWDRYFSYLGSILGAKLEPCWPLFRLKYGGANLAVGALCCVVIFPLLFRPTYGGTPIGPSDGVPPWASILGYYFDCFFSAKFMRWMSWFLQRST